MQTDFRNFHLHISSEILYAHYRFSPHFKCVTTLTQPTLSQLQIYTVSEKNALNLGKCIFVKHGSVFTIFGTESTDNQHAMVDGVLVHSLLLT